MGVILLLCLAVLAYLANNARLTQRYESRYGYTVSYPANWRFLSCQQGQQLALGPGANLGSCDIPLDFGPVTIIGPMSAGDKVPDDIYGDTLISSASMPHFSEKIYEFDAQLNAEPMYEIVASSSQQVFVIYIHKSNALQVLLSDVGVSPIDAVVDSFRM
jgi:hypothetical protein